MFVLRKPGKSKYCLKKLFLLGSLEGIILKKKIKRKVGREVYAFLSANGREQGHPANSRRNCCWLHPRTLPLTAFAHYPCWSKERKGIRVPLLSRNRSSTGAQINGKAFLRNSSSLNKLSLFCWQVSGSFYCRFFYLFGVETDGCVMFY